MIGIVGWVAVFLGIGTPVGLVAAAGWALTGKQRAARHARRVLSEREALEETLMTPDGVRTPWHPRPWTQGLRERGASAVEYGLMVAAIAAVIVGVVFGLGTLVQTAFSKTCTKLAQGPASLGDPASCTDGGGVQNPPPTP